MYYFHSRESELSKGVHFWAGGGVLTAFTEPQSVPFTGWALIKITSMSFGTKKMQYKVMAERAARDRDPIFKHIPKYQLNSEFKDSS